MAKKLRNIIVVLLLLFGIVVVFQIELVCADVSVVDQVTPWTRQTDNHTILNITVTHNNFYSGHFVDLIEIDIDGSIQSIYLAEDSPVDQRSSTWIFQYDMGVVDSTPLVKVGAFCNLHGGNWSTTVQVPEFSLAHIILIMTFILVPIMFLRHKNGYLATKKRGATQRL